MTSNFAETDAFAPGEPERLATEASLSAAQTKINDAIDLVERLAKAARVAAEGFDRDAPEFAGAVRTAAGGAEGFAAGIRQISVDEVVTSVSRITARQPLIAILGAFAIGLAIPLLAAGSSKDRAAR